MGAVSSRAMIATSPMRPLNPLPRPAASAAPPQRIIRPVRPRRAPLPPRARVHSGLQRRKNSDGRAARACALREIVIVPTFTFSQIKASRVRIRNFNRIRIGPRRVRRRSRAVPSSLRQIVLSIFESVEIVLLLQYFVFVCDCTASVQKEQAKTARALALVRTGRRQER